MLYYCFCQTLFDFCIVNVSFTFKNISSIISLRLLLVLLKLLPLQRQKTEEQEGRHRPLIVTELKFIFYLYTTTA